MLRVAAFLVACLAAAIGIDWLANRPGTIVVDWQGYQLETSVLQALVFLTIAIALGAMTWNIVRSLWRSPATVGQMIQRRRERTGLDAISDGMIAIGSGNRQLAIESARQARKSLPNEPLTHLLRAQTAQLQGDNATSRRIFEAMLASPDTEQLGLRGLYMEASREGEPEAARQFAERALKANPALGWPIDALFEMQCKAQEWDGALETLAAGRRHGHVDRKLADRRRAVILAGKAQALEHDNAADALAFASEAHKLAPDLVPAAAVAGRILAGRGQTPQAAKILQKTWRASPHPELAAAYAYARVGDSPTDRVARIKQLALIDPNAAEGAIALATTAIEARDTKTARDALIPFLDTNHQTQRICTLMARLEGADNDSGRAREWLARAVHAPRDPVWTADGVISETWAAVSPITGQLDAFQWRVPVSDLAAPDAAQIAERTERLVALSAPKPRATASASTKAEDAVVALDPETTIRTVTDEATDAVPTKPIGRAPADRTGAARAG